jgi:hypothetical protein
VERSGTDTARLKPKARRTAPAQPGRSNIIESLKLKRKGLMRRPFASKQKGNAISRKLNNFCKNYFPADLKNFLGTCMLIFLLIIDGFI